jgi:hypothetical protein
MASFRTADLMVVRRRDARAAGAAAGGLRAVVG